MTATTAVGALMEVRDADGVWRGTSGVAEQGTSRAVPEHARFRAGSTKTFVADRWRTWTAEERIDRAVADPATFEPTGSRYSSSNTGYLILRDGGARLVDSPRMNPSMMGAGGEIISTAGDLNRFMAALLDGRLLPEHLLDAMRTPGVAGAGYGLGMRWRDTSCGVRVYGNDGDALAYQAWSFSTEDQDRQVTVALTPTFRGDPDDAVEALLDAAGRD